MSTTTDAMRKLSKKSTKDLKARWERASGKSAEGWTRDSLIKELASLAASGDAGTTEPAAESAASGTEPTAEEAPPPSTTIEYDEPNDTPQPEETQEAAPDAASPEEPQMRTSTKSKSKARKPKAHRPPKPKAERKPRKAKEPKDGERKARLGDFKPGDAVERVYKGKTIKAKATEGGWIVDGEVYPSLTAIALKVTGAKSISGRYFFRLWKAKGD